MLNFSKTKIIAIVIFCLFIIFFFVSSIFNRQESSIFPEYFKELIPKSNLGLGLDLQGGSQITLQIDFPYYIKEQLENFKDDIKAAFREKAIRALPKIQGNKIKFNVINEVDESKIKKIIYSVNPDLNISTEDDSYEIVISDELLNKMKSNVIKQSIEIIRHRIDENGTKEPLIQAQGNNRILLQVPGIQDSSQVKYLLGKTDRKSTRLNSSHSQQSRMPSSA